MSEGFHKSEVRIKIIISKYDNCGKLFPMGPTIGIISNTFFGIRTLVNKRKLHVSDIFTLKSMGYEIEIISGRMQDLRDYEEEKLKYEKTLKGGTIE